jgi:uncharacterized membrane protein YbhN (UPF0104 family)
MKIRPETRSRLWIGAKWVGGIVLVAFLALTLSRQWAEVRETLHRMPWGYVGVSTLLAAAAVACSGQQQRVLLTGLGAPTINGWAWSRAFFVSQLAKYVPGSGLAYVAQMELSRSLGVRRALSVVAMTVGVIVTLVLSFALAGLLIGQESLAAIPIWVQIPCVALALAALVAFAIRPGALSAVLRRIPAKRFSEGFRTIRLERSGPTLVWSLAAWLAYGAHFWILLVPFVPDRLSALQLSIGGYPLAWAVGFLAIVIPAGVGVREIVLAAILAPVTGQGVALTLATVSRFVIVVAEAILSAFGALAGIRARSAAAHPPHARPDS